MVGLIQTLLVLSTKELDCKLVIYNCIASPIYSTRESVTEYQMSKRLTMVNIVVFFLIAPQHPKKAMTKMIPPTTISKIETPPTFFDVRCI